MITEKEIRKVRDAVVELRSRAWLHPEILSPEVLKEIEDAAVSLTLAVNKFVVK